MLCRLMADVAQLVRARVCGTRGRGFDSRRSPHRLQPIPESFNLPKYIVYKSSLQCDNIDKL